MVVAFVGELHKWGDFEVGHIQGTHCRDREINEERKNRN